MFIFNHRAKLESASGANFCALFNPEDNKGVLRINRIQFNASTTVDVQIFSINTLDLEGMPDASEQIQSFSLDGKLSDALAFGSSWDVKVLDNQLKTCRVFNGKETTLIYPDEELKIPSGGGILIRVFAYEGQIVGNCSISFKETTRD